MLEGIPGGEDIGIDPTLAILVSDSQDQTSLGSSNDFTAADPFHIGETKTPQNAKVGKGLHYLHFLYSN